MFFFCCILLDVCLLSVEPGPCRKSLGRWYYDSAKTRCIYFAYGGCEGNANRFMTQEECMSHCGYPGEPPQSPSEPDYRHPAAEASEPPFHVASLNTPRVLGVIDQGRHRQHHYYYCALINYNIIKD